MRLVKNRCFSPKTTAQFIGCFVSLGAGAASVGAQPTDAPLSSPSPISASTSGFLLDAGDTIAISVANHPEMESKGLVVSETGKIALPVIGNLSVAGKTVREAQRLITKAYSTQLRQPQVTVTLVQSKLRQIIILGSVVKPGTLDLRPGWRVSDAIAASGGLNALVDDIIPTLNRGKKQAIRLDLDRITKAPQTDSNITLRENDVLSLSPWPGRTVTVSGDVKSPGSVILRRGIRLLDALTAVGGLTQAPNTTQITILRGGNKLSADATAAFGEQNAQANLTLLNGDLVNVRAIRTTVSIVSLNSLVKAPGSYLFNGNVGVIQALFRAGGLSVPPNQAVASIRRGTTNIPVDLVRASYNPDFDIPLLNDDVLLVSPPEGPTVQMAGSVSRPGELNLRKDSTLLDALLMAGGISVKPSEARISILREVNGRSIVMNADPVGLIALRDLGQNVRLQDGDLVMVNQVNNSNSVFISGEVNTPGTFQIGENDGLVELLLRAGGPTSFASLRQARIVRRDGTNLSVDASHVMEPDAPRLQVPLQEGDLIIVPRNPNQVLVMNAVGKPGYYAIPENGTLTLGNAILLAGGARDRARLKEVALIRRLASGEVSRQIVPMDQYAAGKIPLDVQVIPGDVIYVPESKTSPSMFRQVISTLSGLSILRNFVGP